VTELILKLSGIISILITWLFVVVPAIRSGIDNKRQTISSATKKREVAIPVSFGLIIGTLFQILFLSYLLKRFELGYLNFGSILFLTTNLATIMVALLPEYKYFKAHSFFVKYYFVFNPISLLYISYLANNVLLFAVAIVSVILYFSGIIRIIMQEGVCARVEQWAFFTLSILTIFMTVI